MSAWWVIRLALGVVAVWIGLCAYWRHQDQAWADHEASQLADGQRARDLELHDDDWHDW